LELLSLQTLRARSLQTPVMKQYCRVIRGYLSFDMGPVRLHCSGDHCGYEKLVLRLLINATITFMLCCSCLLTSWPVVIARSRLDVAGLVDGDSSRRSYSIWFVLPLMLHEFVELKALSDCAVLVRIHARVPCYLCCTRQAPFHMGPPTASAQSTVSHLTATVLLLASEECAAYVWRYQRTETGRAVPEIFDWQRNSWWRQRAQSLTSAVMLASTH
jgi:hypothetical protein